MAEERLHVRKSVPVLVAAALIWGFTGLAYSSAGHASEAAELVRHTLLDFAELLLFLLPAMTYVNTLDERGLFDVLRARLVAAGLSLRALFWVTGALAFVVSPVADNLTTALHQHRRGRKCRRGIQPIRRHHHAHGLASG